MLEEAAKKLKKEPQKCNLITIHLGGGSSITAIKDGQAIDTSMGFTPLEGLVMSTRPGDLDPGVVDRLYQYFEESGSTNPHQEIHQMLNNESGIYGLCGVKNYLDLLSVF